MTLDQHVFDGYLPILIVIIIALIIASVMLGAHYLLGQIPKEITKKKYDTYECGVPYEGSAHQQFSVRYYLIGIVFLVFDVEVVFLYPWALLYKKMVAVNPFVIFEMLVFLVILFAGYIYLRLCGALEWD
jgi:NADH-quinone oxidoreductase subunit A